MTPIRSLLATLLLAISASAAAAQTRLGQGPVQPFVPHLEFGPVAGFTTALHDAPDRLLLPLGRVVTFRVSDLQPGQQVLWDGLRAPGPLEIDYPCLQTGVAQIGCTLLPDGTRLESQLFIAAFEPADLTFETEFGTEHEIELSEDMSNEDSVALWMAARGIGPVHDLGDRRAVSIRNRMRWEAQVDLGLPTWADDLGADALIEWRVDGQPIGSGSVSTSFGTHGEFAVTVGPPALQRRIDFVAYEVHVDCNIPEGQWMERVPINYTAVTNPPGYESLVTWLACTKYGETTPRLGQGRRFATTFTQTFGLGPSADAWQWVGVLGGHDRLGQDRKEDDAYGFDISDDLSGFASCPSGERELIAYGWRRKTYDNGTNRIEAFVHGGSIGVGVENCPFLNILETTPRFKGCLQVPIDGDDIELDILDCDGTVIHWQGAPGGGWFTNCPDGTVKKYSSGCLSPPGPGAGWSTFWSSSDPSVVDVDDNGCWTADGIGTAEVSRVDVQTIGGESIINVMRCHFEVVL